MHTVRPTRRTPGATVVPHAIRPAVACIVFLAAAIACSPEPRTAAGDSASVASSLPAVPASEAPVADSLEFVGKFVGKLLSDVVPDSSLLSSWAVYPVERHIGIRLALVGGRHYLLADTLVGYDGPAALWRIRQAQSVDAPRAGEGYVSSCALPGADAADGTVVARVTLSAGEALTPIHAAWRLDPATWQFRPFPTDSLSCYNEGGGP